ncbi:hypothetical protein Pint_15354 [Pistacia integerrima]|uniref:Uncharacterized protein n=1 Tax=Pistacia integerrima TaxID=434235 RepID=A0ACC0ZB82_9ROSI|nr:hypothetical protein Pint_15354 [Pistacia integerrima]
MGVASKAGDLIFKAFTAGLGVATIYLTATFSVNVYRGLAWHNAQSVTTHSLSRFQKAIHCIYVHQALVFDSVCLVQNCAG